MRNNGIVRCSVMTKKVNKWALPGWKNEPKYTTNKVLVGNWFEERLVFPKGNATNNSTNRTDFCVPNTEASDRMTRRKLAHRNWEGVGENNLLAHHGKSYIPSSTESNYGHDYGYPCERIPYPLRRWNSHTMSWVPERIDVPSRVYTTKNLQKSSEEDDIMDGVNNQKCGILPPINIPTTWDGRVVLKYRHRKTDIAPYFPVILRSCQKRAHVVNLQKYFK